MKLIKLTKGYSTIVDDEDYEFLNQYKWWYSGNGYAIGKFGKGKTISLHRYLAVTPKGMFTDHIDGNRLNNQKSNLRVCTRLENSRNRKKSNRWTSLFKGVRHKSPSHRGKSWKAEIRYKGKLITIGSFDNEIHAALAYDLWAVDIYGQFAKTNFVITNHQ